jgi:8-oxo-dGTP diphosphatase
MGIRSRVAKWTVLREREIIIGDSRETPMPRKIVKIGLAVVKDGCLLLVRKRGSDCLILPGGKPEQGEDDLTALGREIAEELGCTLSLQYIHYLGAFRDRAAGLTNTDVVVKLYAGTLIGEPAPHAEIEQLVWFNPRTGTSVELAPSLTNSIVPYLFQTGRVRQNSHGTRG